MLLQKKKKKKELLGISENQVIGPVASEQASQQTTKQTHGTQAFYEPGLRYHTRNLLNGEEAKISYFYGRLFVTDIHLGGLFFQVKKHFDLAYRKYSL